MRRRFGFPLRALFVGTLLLAVVLGLFRFLALHPVLIGPVLTLVGILVILQGPHWLRGRDSAVQRFALGCIVLPTLTLIGMCGIGTLIMILRNIMVPDGP